MVSVDNQLAWMPSTIGTDTSQQNKPLQLALNPPGEDAPAHEFNFFGDDGFSFMDVLDVINPLQHIPLVSTFYREATGDTIAAAPRVAGSTLFFGPLGLASAIANVFVEESTGRDIGQHMAGWINPAFENADVADASAAAVPADAPVETVLDPADPVLAWARGEADWVKQGMSTRGKGTPTSAPARAHDGDEAPPLPDAAPFLRDEPAPPEEPFGLAEMAYLTQDIQSAARAYAAAANLNPPG